jgi:hypothetical protein
MLCPSCFALFGCPVCFALYAGIDARKGAPADVDPIGPDDVDETRTPAEYPDDG